MAQYLLLLRSDPSAWDNLSPEQMQRTVEKYVTWRNRPFVVGSNRLEMTGRLMQKKDDKIGVTDGPFSESREVLGGYFAIEAKDLDEAVARTMDHPHFEFGSIEIREIMPRPEAN